MDTLKNRLKCQIIEELNLEDITPDDIGDDTPFFEEGLGLDSIDALELVVIMENFYGVSIDDPEKGREILYSIKTMAEYIEKHKAV